MTFVHSKTGILLASVMILSSLLTSLSGARPRGIETKDEMDAQIAEMKTSRGGSLSIEPSVMLPVGRLAAVLEPSLGVDLNFDVGVSPTMSWVFGVGAFDMKGKSNPDLHLKLLPAWMGLRWKYRMVPTIETYWEMGGAAYYEYLTFQNDILAKQDYLTAGGLASAGMNVFFTKWLMMGAQTRLHFIVEQGNVFPMMQFGLMIGIRG